MVRFDSRFEVFLGEEFAFLNCSQWRAKSRGRSEIEVEPKSAPTIKCVSRFLGFVIQRIQFALSVVKSKTF